jgi:hypothetical protein
MELVLTGELHDAEAAPAGKPAMTIVFHPDHQRRGVPEVRRSAKSRPV